MAKIKRIVSSTKTESRNDVRKKDLKVVLTKIKYPLSETTKKSNLIEKLLLKERKTLKLHHESCILSSVPEENTVQDQILNLLNKKKETIFARTTDSESSDIEKSVPAKVLQATNKWKQQQKIAFAIIPKIKMDTFLNKLNMQPHSSEYNMKLNKCLSRLHQSCTPPWNSPSCILRAMNDCILHRRWNNLIHLLLMMIRLPFYYRPLIRHMCEIMDKLHPVIQNNGLQNQFKYINQIDKVSRGHV